MAHFDLIEKPRRPRKMIQPTKDYLRAELKLADAEIKRLQADNERLRMPFWKRLLRKSP
jgi:hypothetical protein